MMGDSGKLRARYFREALRHLQAKDYQAALLGFDRVAEIDGPGGIDRKAEYSRAICLDALGEHDRAESVMDRLAPEGHVGFAAAHAWKARKLLAAAGRSPALTRDAESHLLLALQDAPDTIEVHDQLARFYLATGQSAKAIPHLERIVAARPDLLIALARAFQAQGNRFQARERAGEARAFYRKQAEANLDDFGARLRWVEAAVFLEDFPTAVSALEHDASLGRDPRYRRALSQVYAAWFDALERSPRSELAQRMELIEKGLDLDPSNEALITRFARLIRAGGEEAARARAALQTLVSGGGATGPVHFALGLDAWMDGRRAEACIHWEEAFRLDPRSPVLANNLACALAAGASPDLDRALGTINPVIALWPGDARFRETRGQILTKLERWREALPDLKAALVVYPDHAALHQALAETYTHLKASSMAAEHRKRADDLEATAGLRAPARGPVR
jgi:tetratricopeptide (TPR) repeat protein